MIKLTKSEQEVMELLWASEEPLSSREIIAKSKDKTWKDSYIHIIINSLLEKNMIQVSGVQQTTKNYTRIFSPTISKDKWMISQISESEHSSSTIKYLFGEILQQIHDQESLNELSDFIEKQKKRIEKNRRGQTD